MRTTEMRLRQIIKEAISLLVTEGFEGPRKEIIKDLSAPNTFTQVEQALNKFASMTSDLGSRDYLSRFNEEPDGTGLKTPITSPVKVSHSTTEDVIFVEPMMKMSNAMMTVGEFLDSLNVEYDEHVGEAWDIPFTLGRGTPVLFKTRRGDVFPLKIRFIVDDNPHPWEEYWPVENVIGLYKNPEIVLEPDLSRSLTTQQRGALSVASRHKVASAIARKHDRESPAEFPYYPELGATQMGPDPMKGFLGRFHGENPSPDDEGGDDWADRDPSQYQSLGTQSGFRDDLDDEDLDGAKSDYKFRQDVLRQTPGLEAQEAERLALRAARLKAAKRPKGR